MIPRLKDPELPLFARPAPLPFAGIGGAIFDAEHPGVFAAFRARAIELKRSGVPHYSSRSIIHDLRHWTGVRDGSEFKTNNVWSPLLSRRLRSEMPEFNGWFAERKSKHDAQ